MPERMKCAYVDHASVKCEGPVITTIHDARGCLDVCFAHTKWRHEQCSVLFGHGSTCARKVAP